MKISEMAKAIEDGHSIRFFRESDGAGGFIKTMEDLWCVTQSNTWWTFETIVCYKGQEYQRLTVEGSFEDIAKIEKHIYTNGYQVVVKSRIPLEVKE